MNARRHPGLALAAILCWLLGGSLSCRPVTGVVEGQVLDPSGKPEPGAAVAVFPLDPVEGWSGFERVAWQRTDRRGRFRFSLPPGPHGLSVSHPAFIGANVSRFSVDPGSTYTLPFPLQLQGGGSPLRGEIRDLGGHPLDGILGLVPPLGGPLLTAASVRLVRIRDGRYEVAVAPGTYFFLPWAKGLMHPGEWLEAGRVPQDRNAVLVPEPSPAPRKTVGWLQAQAVPLETGDPGRLDGLLRSGAVLGLGEATHGSREFRQIVHEVIQCLGGRGEPRAIALELSPSDGFTLDAFIQGEESESVQALPLAYRTGEIRDLLQWLRRFNGPRPRDSRFRIYGIDPADPGPAYRWALTFFRRHDPRTASHFQRVLGDLGSAREAGFPGDQARADRWRAALELLQRRLDALTTALDSRSLERQRRSLVALGQFIPLAVDLTGGSRARELAMAENVRWVLRQEGVRGRVLVFAHCGHVARSLRNSMGWPTMGWHLAQELGADYVPVAMTFRRGGFMALEAGREDPAWVPFEVGPDPRATLDEALGSTGLPRLLLDLRPGRPQGETRRWLDSPQGVRFIPLCFDPSRPHALAINAPEELDALIFLERIHPSQPWAASSPRPGSPGAFPVPGAW